MSLVFNGTTVAPEGTINFNGSSAITRLIVNGTDVWPIFSAGTNYQLVSSVKNDYTYWNGGNFPGWTTIWQKTFVGASGTVLSVRAYSYSGGYGENSGYGYGRVLQNGNQICEVEGGWSAGDNYSSFVNITVNYGDVITIQSAALNYIWAGYNVAGYEGGGGQIYSANNPTVSKYFV